MSSALEFGEESPQKDDFALPALIQAVVHGLNGDTLVILVRPYETVSTLKLMICEQWHRDPFKQQLALDDRLLGDNDIIVSHCAPNGDGHVKLNLCCVEVDCPAAICAALRRVRSCRDAPRGFQRLVMNAMIPHLQSPMESCRLAAVEAIPELCSRLEDRDIYRNLFLLAEDASEEVRCAVMQTLGEISRRGDGAVESVICNACLRDGDKDVRLAAARSVVMVSDFDSDKARWTFQKGLSDRNRHVRRASVEGIAALNGSDASLFDLIRSAVSDWDPDVRRTAIEIFGKRGPVGHPQLITLLCDALVDQDCGVRRLAMKALGRVAKRGDHRVVAALKSVIGGRPSLAQEEFEEAWQVLA